MTAPGRNTPQRRTALGRRIRNLLLLGLAATGLAAVLASNWQLIVGTIEERAIAAERAKRRAMWALGQPLPGTPELARLNERLAASGFTLKQPILMRIFKREFELEVWKLKDQRFQLFATYPICRWSGRLGPKLETGDRQAPEGFYWVAANQLNPNSRWRRSFNLGFPNAYDRALGRSGSFLMVHGGCGSVGCYAMTDAVVDEIWRLVTSALAAGRAGSLPGAGFPVPHERRQHGGASWRAEFRVLAAIEGRRRPVRGHRHAARSSRVQGPLSVSHRSCW